MPVEYKQIVPWGRNLEEYQRMFSLNPSTDLPRRILGCGDGPASFNMEWTKLGGQVTSLDPIYYFTRAEIEQRIAETYTTVLEQTSANREKFVWQAIASPEELGRIRMATMQNFVKDYEAGRAAGRYIPGELPVIPFPDQSFDLALSSHFLFLYSENLTLDFHLSAIREMLRVAGEVRIFPLLDVNAQESRHLHGVIEALQAHKPKIMPVNYEFQRGGNQMLVLER